jgi:iron complex transport system ATP-binding protein
MGVSGAILRASGVGINRGERFLVREVDLEVFPGEVVAVVGPNGAGKSTLLAALAGDLAPQIGRVAIAGRDIAELRMHERARLRAVMPQATSLSFPFTADDVVRSGRSPWRSSPQAADDDAIVEQAIAVADVGTFRHRVFNTLSGGEQSRTILARTWAQATPIMLLDEPTAALDLQHQSLVAMAMRARADAGAGVVVVLHDLGLAGDCADRIVIMQEGHIVMDAAPELAFDPDLLSKVYREDVVVMRPSADLGWVVAPRRQRPF